ncbi:TIGR01212 family radical SAM protein [Oceanispirochaeta crateris]|uniref:TIGR01212 family radical SAM protein n=1 Tax=Oceanispirochaeta crateris TaxID=2518645 RepID=A0A5C1QPZ6_9SPIO|nr:TIGR01212 family radical SAM protein [Oceanispirochaeta crateris]
MVIMVPVLFRQYSQYLREKYGETVYRIGVDGGFSCPNRGSDRNAPGCAYCDVYGVRAAYLGEETQSLEAQILRSIAVLKKRYKAETYILYFQAYSSTWGSVSHLKKIYDHGLSLGNFVELVVSTRPDCINEKIADLLGSYVRPNFDVWVELGLQSAQEETLKRINRGHSVEQFERAYHLLRAVGVKIAVHLIFGLPGEDRDLIMKSVDYLASLKPEAVKFHNLHIPTGSPLYAEYEAGELSFPDSGRHIHYVVDALERIPEETIIMRMTTDTPRLRHRVPGVFLNKSSTYEQVQAELERRGSRQGSQYHPNRV